MAKCLACSGELQREAYESGILRCVSCRAYILDGEATRTVFSERHGLDIEDLRALVTSEIRSYPCPTCLRKMDSVIVNYNALDICFGCGTMFLDRSEGPRILFETAD